MLTYARCFAWKDCVRGLPFQPNLLYPSSRYRHATFSLPKKTVLSVTSFAEAVTSSTDKNLPWYFLPGTRYKVHRSSTSARRERAHYTYTNGYSQSVLFYFVRLARVLLLLLALTRGLYVGLAMPPSILRFRTSFFRTHRRIEVRCSLCLPERYDRSTNPKKIPKTTKFTRLKKEQKKNNRADSSECL